MDNKRETEIYSSNEENEYEEYSLFPAEDYKTPELKNEGKEDFKVEEFSLGDEEKKKEEKEKVTDFEKLKDKIFSHSSMMVTTTAVAVVSASVLGFVPGISEDKKEDNPLGTVITDSLVDNSSFHEISIEGDMEIGSDVSRYYALIEEYGKEEKKEEYYAELNFTDSHFSFYTDAFYGIESYRYTILAFTGSEEENVIYSSSLIPFEFDQSYKGSYRKLKPTEAKITFTENDMYDVEIDT